MSKPRPADGNPWDPKVWSQFSPKHVSRDGSSGGVVEVVRAPTDDEIRVLQTEIPEAAGKCLFVLEREAGAPSAAPALPPNATAGEAQVLLVNAGYAWDRIYSAAFYGDESVTRVKEPYTLTLSARVRVSVKTAYRWKKTALWQSEVGGALVVLHAAEALDGSKAFGNLWAQFRPDPGYRSECDPSRLSYSGDPAQRPPLALPSFQGNVELLLGHAPRRAQTVGEDGEAHAELVARFPRLATTCYWLTGHLDADMTSYGFVLATVFSDPTLISADRDPGVFLAPPWVPVTDPSSVPADQVLVALFSAPAEAEHVALRSRWSLDGALLFESRLDLAPPSSMGLRFVHTLEALTDGAVGTVVAYYTLQP
jgi:hypothetical protein